MDLSLAGPDVTTLFLVLLRLVGFVVAAPVLGTRSVPPQVKAGLAAVLAVAVFREAQVAPSPAPLLLAAPIEVLLGVALGYLMSLAFAAIEIVAKLVAAQVGLGLDGVLNPLTEHPGTIFDSLFSTLAALLFLAAGLHVALVAVITGSFQAFPVGGGLPPALPETGSALVSLTIALGVQVALPIAVVLLITDLVVALLARAIPQINVFVLGLPLKLLVGLVALLIALPAIAGGMRDLFDATLRAVAGAGL